MIHSYSADVWLFSGDFLRSITSTPKALPELFPAFVPYAIVLALFVGFVVWNGGIALGGCFSGMRIDMAMNK